MYMFQFIEGCVYDYLNLVLWQLKYDVHYTVSKNICMRKYNKL